jgi:hypothetical protein
VAWLSGLFIRFRGDIGECSVDARSVEPIAIVAMLLSHASSPRPSLQSSISMRSISGRSTNASCDCPLGVRSVTVCVTLEVGENAGAPFLVASTPRHELR